MRRGMEKKLVLEGRSFLRTDVFWTPSEVLHFNTFDSIAMAIERSQSTLLQKVGFSSDQILVAKSKAEKKDRILLCCLDCSSSQVQLKISSLRFTKKKVTPHEVSDEEAFFVRVFGRTNTFLGKLSRSRRCDKYVSTPAEVKSCRSLANNMFAALADYVISEEEESATTKSVRSCNKISKSLNTIFVFVFAQFHYITISHLFYEHRHRYERSIRMRMVPRHQIRPHLYVHIT